MELNKINMLLKFQYARKNWTKAIFTMPYLKSITKVILFALVKIVGMKQVSANRGSISSPVDEASIWGWIPRRAELEASSLWFKHKKLELEARQEGKTQGKAQFLRSQFQV